MLRIQANTLHNQNSKTKPNFGERLSVRKTELWTACFVAYTATAAAISQFMDQFRRFILRRMFYAAIKPDVNLYIFHHMKLYGGPATGKLVANSA